MNPNVKVRLLKLHSIVSICQYLYSNYPMEPVDEVEFYKFGGSVGPENMDGPSNLVVNLIPIESHPNPYLEVTLTLI